ncbi:MAG: hypothetical protein C4582_05250 [Desulfobacteraceae bacterium]|nr:MAG: hypothetical protein C4582_05250 [Desulfobacteraceae bacterium]
MLLKKSFNERADLFGCQVLPGVLGGIGDHQLGFFEVPPPNLVGPEKVRFFLFKKVLHDWCFNFFGYSLKKFIKVVCLHLAAPNHAADNLVINTILCDTRISAKIISYNIADLLVKSPFVLFTSNGNCCGHLFYLWLAEINDKILSDISLLSPQLLEAFLHTIYSN